MYSYAGASASATTLTPFSEPPSTTNSSGQGSQAAAAAQASATPAGSIQTAMSQAQQALSAVPSALSGAATPAQALSPLDLINLLGSLSGILVDPELSGAGLVVDSTALPYDVVGALTGFHTDDIVSGWAGIQSWPGMAAVPPTPFPVITNLNSPVSAGMGTANVVGKMSVPTAWAMAAPEIRPLAVMLPAASVAAAETGASAGSVFSQMALAGMAGRALAGSTGAGGAGGAGAAGNRERIGARVGAPTQKPAEPAPPEPPAVPKTPAGGPITGIAAELRELASLRDSGILTDEEFTEQKRRLLPQ